MSVVQGGQEPSKSLKQSIQCVLEGRGGKRSISSMIPHLCFSSPGDTLRYKDSSTQNPPYHSISWRSASRI